MAGSDYFTTSRPSHRPGPSVLSSQTRLAANTPGSPRTPLLGRSVSSQFGSPGSFRAEQEDIIVWEVGVRHLSAGYAGEARPRCTLRFGPGLGRLVDDYRAYARGWHEEGEREVEEMGWSERWELYSSDLRTLDLRLVEDKLAHAVRLIHANYFQLDAKPRKALLAIPSLLPTPVLEMALKVLFEHFSHPPSILILTVPILACIGAGLRNGLVIDLGWEETVCTAVGEYREVCQRRSDRAGKLLTREMAEVLNKVVEKGSEAEGKQGRVGFRHAEDVMERMGWCRPAPDTTSLLDPAVTKAIPLPHPFSAKVAVPLVTLSHPVESVLFSPQTDPYDHDDNHLPLQHLAHQVLLSLPFDLRALCLGRIIVTGGLSSIPGVKHRILFELQRLMEVRGWDRVARYGSAKVTRDLMKKQALNAVGSRLPERLKPPLSGDAFTGVEPPETPTTMANPQTSVASPPQNLLPPHARPHDDLRDPITLKAERNHAIGRRNLMADSQDARTGLRGAETLGAWAGASLVASLRVKGAHEIEREDWLKHGLRDTGILY